MKQVSLFDFAPVAGEVKPADPLEKKREVLRQGFPRPKKPSSGKHIAEPGEYVQSRAFGKPWPLDVYPRVQRTESQYRTLVLKCAEQKIDLGLDLETNLKGVPSILGVGYYDLGGGECVSIPWSDSLAKWTINLAGEAGIRLVAHSALGADRPWVERQLKIKTPIKAWWCSMLSHYAANMHLTKQAQKEEDEDEGGSLGMMNLWSMLRVLPLSLYNYKVCRGAHGCYGPCPTHSVFEYNGLDAWASPCGKFYHQQFFDEFGVPASFLEHLHEMSAICYAMQRRGVRIDQAFLEVFDTEWAKESEAIRARLPFNPQSEPQIKQYFKDLTASLNATSKYNLRDTQKETIKELIDELAPETPGYQELVDLFTLKACGKGSKAWFRPENFTPFQDLTDEEKAARRENGQYTYLHPRWNNTGTCMGRLSCANPNAMNIPSRGNLARVRKAIIAAPGYQILKADAKQLEVRMAVWEVGDDPWTCIKLDFFSDLVAKSGGKFEEVATKKNATLPPGVKPFTARDIAKVVGHACTNGEGMELKELSELRSERNRKLIDSGAIRVYPEWRFEDKVVCFSGINLARRMFGNYKDESRVLANNLLFDIYLNLVPWIIPFQQKVSREVWDTGGVKGIDGSFLRLDSPVMKENFKQGFSKRSQGSGAAFMQYKMREDFHRDGSIWTLQVHDEMVKEVPLSLTREELKSAAAFLEEPSPYLPGLRIPFEVKFGPAWGTLELL